MRICFDDDDVVVIMFDLLAVVLFILPFLLSMKRWRCGMICLHVVG